MICFKGKGLVFKGNELVSGLFHDILCEKGVHAMGKEIFNIVNDMYEVYGVFEWEI